MIDTGVVERLLAHTTARHELSVNRTEVIHACELSVVYRLHLPNQSMIFKCAARPFTGEAAVLRWADRHRLPVPGVLAAARRDGHLAMVLQDLGPHTRTADEPDAAEAAVRIHRAPAPRSLRRFGPFELANLPGLTLDRLVDLRRAGRLNDASGLYEPLAALSTAAYYRADRGHLQPFGFCHGELHPTSIHLRSDGYRLLDFGKAFRGPGLLDLATWYGTRQPTDPDRLTQLIERYVAAGGHRDALARRGGLPAAAWALGWHRVWAAAWFIEQAATGAFDATTDAAHTVIVRRQLTAAAALLRC